MRRGGIPYSDQETAWLEANRSMVISDYHRAFQAAFDREDVTAEDLHRLRKRKGWKVGRVPGRYVGRGRKYSKEEIAWLSENCTLPIADYHKAFVERFDRGDVTPAKLISLRKREGWKTGRTGQFDKGSVPANKGKPCPPGKGGRHPNARRTQFKKGDVAHNFIGAGHERLDDQGGYVIMTVAETNPWNGHKTRPVHKHRYLWEKANGPVPDGHVLKCLDGDKTNCDPSNWEPIPRELLPHLNSHFGLGYDQASPEAKPVIMTIAKLKAATRAARRRRGERSEGRP